jgi:hypothetical protein
MSKEVAEVLTKARDILEDMGWTKRYLAREINNISVKTDSPQATCFCSLGALAKAKGRRSYSAECLFQRACRIQLSEAMDLNIIGTNDDEETRLIHVLMAFDFAILMAKENKVTV